MAFLTSFFAASAQAIKLLMPALFPSWRFFDMIAPSPRVEVCLLETLEAEAGNWWELRPKQATVSAPELATRFFWNARWNETLFLTSCAERMIQAPSAHSERELRHRIRSDLMTLKDTHPVVPFFRFRLVFVSRDEQGQIARDILFVSRPCSMFDERDRT